MLELLINKLNGMSLKYDNEKLEEMAHGHNAPLKGTKEFLQTGSGICFESRPLVCEVAESMKLRNELFFVKFCSGKGTYIYRHAMSVIYDPSRMEWGIVEFNGLRNRWVVMEKGKTCEDALSVFIRENNIVNIKRIDPRLLNQSSMDLYDYFEITK